MRRKKRRRKSAVYTTQEMRLTYAGVEMARTIALTEVSESSRGVCSLFVYHVLSWEWRCLDVTETW